MMKNLMTRARNMFGADPVQTSAQPPAPGGVRTSVQNSTTVIKSSDPAVVELLGGGQAASGFAVNDFSAMRVSTVYACVRLICSTIADLPIAVYERIAGQTTAIDTPLWYLLNEQPSPMWTAAAMWEFLLKSMMLRGDGFAEIQRDRFGGVLGFLPIHPDRVYVEEVGGRLRYLISPREGKPYGRDQDDMLHLPGFGFDGLRGMSIIMYAAFQAIGISLAADGFSGKFFANGAMPKHVFTTPQTLLPEQVELMRKQYEERYAGQENAGRPMVLTQDTKMQTLALSSADAELLATRKYQVVDICRAFGVPPFMVGAQEATSTWGSGVEQLTLGFLKFTCQPYLTRVQQELNRKLFSTPRNFVGHQLDALLRSDAKSEADYYRQALGGSQGPGWMTQNEIRRAKNLPPVEGGDKLYDPKKDKQTNEQTTTPAAA